MSTSSTSPRPGAEPAGRGHPSSGPPQFKGKYLSLTTVKRDGTGVATPVWFVAEAGTILVVTGAESHKVRRIHHNPAVTVAECTASGRLRSSRYPPARTYSPATKRHAPGSSWPASTGSTRS